MSGQKIRDATNAAIEFVTTLSATTGAQAGIVSWSSNILSDLTSPALTDDFPILIHLINSTATTGGTDLNDGLIGANNLLDTDMNTGLLKVIIFLTDGQGTYTTAANGGPANTSATNGTKIYAIGIGSSVRIGNLEDMANATGGIAFPNFTSANLTQIFMDIFTDVVTSTIPHMVNVVETTLDYIAVDCASAMPRAVTCDTNQNTGQTTLTWDDIGTFSDGDTKLMANEVVTLSFEATSTSPQGGALPVNDPDAKVTFEDSLGNMDEVPIPQAFIVQGIPTSPTTRPPTTMPQVPTSAPPPTRRYKPKQHHYKPRRHYKKEHPSKGSTSMRGSKTMKGSKSHKGRKSSKGSKSQSMTKLCRRKRKRENGNRHHYGFRGTPPANSFEFFYLRNHRRHMKAMWWYV